METIGRLPTMEAPFEDEVTTPFHKDEDQTKPVRTYLPSFEEVREVVSRHSGVTVAYYDPNGDLALPWLWLDSPSGVVKVFRYQSLNALDGVAREAAQDVRYLLCPDCGHRVPRRDPPVGIHFCSTCYNKHRRLVDLGWRGPDRPDVPAGHWRPEASS